MILSDRPGPVWSVSLHATTYPTHQASVTKRRDSRYKPRDPPDLFYFAAAPSFFLPYQSGVRCKPGEFEPRPAVWVETSEEQELLMRQDLNMSLPGGYHIF